MKIECTYLVKCHAEKFRCNSFAALIFYIVNASCGVDTYVTRVKLNYVAQLTVPYNIRR